MLAGLLSLSLPCLLQRASSTLWESPYLSWLPSPPRPPPCLPICLPMRAFFLFSDCHITQQHLCCHCVFLFHNSKNDFYCSSESETKAFDAFGDRVKTDRTTKRLRERFPHRLCLYNIHINDEKAPTRTSSCGWGGGEKEGDSVPLPLLPRSPSAPTFSKDQLAIHGWINVIIKPVIAINTAWQGRAVGGLEFQLW